MPAAVPFPTILVTFSTEKKGFLMRTFTPSSWGKMLMAGVAVLVVGGPGFVLADPGPARDYLTPRAARLNGPSKISTNTPIVYTLTVFFQDGSSSVFGNPPATFSQPRPTLNSNGSFTGNTYTATSIGKVVLKGSYTSASKTVEGIRSVKIR